MTSDVPAPRAVPRRRRRRWLRVLLVLTVLLVVGWVVVVPAVLRVAVAASLRDAGFPVARVGAVAVSASRIEVQDVHLLGASDVDGEITIERATAEFAMRDLLGGRIDTLTVTGAAWTRSPLAERATSPFVRARVPVDAAPAAAAGLPALPLRRCELHDVVIATRGAPLEERLHLDATFDATGPTWRLESHVAFGASRGDLRADIANDGGALEGSLTVRSTGIAELALDGRLRVEPASRRLALRFDDASVAMNGVQMNGIAADLELDDFTAPATRTPQTVRWRELTAGTITAGTGEATFDLRSGQEVQARIVQRTTDGSGSINVRELRWKPGEQRFPMTIDVRSVPLREWIELASSGRITGDGRLDGDLAIVLTFAPRLAIDLRGGHLTAAPGGLVRFLDHPDTDAIIRQHVQAIAASTGHDALVQERLVAALKEFRYSALDFVFERDTVHDDTTLRVHLAGEGANVPQQLDMDVNLHGFDTALDTALAIKLGLDRARERLDRKVDAPTNDSPEEK